MYLQKRPAGLLLNPALFTLIFGISLGCFAQTDFSPDMQEKIRQLNSANAEERGQAACFLGEIRAETAIRELVAILGDDTPIDLVICGQRGKHARLEPAKSSSPGMEAARSLASIGADAFMPLVGTLQSKSAHARQNAVLALGLIGDGRALKPLLSVFRDESSEVRGKTVWALAILKADNDTILPLIGALFDESPDVRQKAAWALGVVRDERAVKSLIVATQDESSSVRERAVWALSNYTLDKRVVKSLINALHDQVPIVREKAARALGTIGTEVAPDALIEALFDKSAGVRERAAWSLGEIRDPRALDALKIAAKDEDPKVRKHAAEAIDSINRKKKVRF